jgi:hypothetical protein
MKPCHSSHRKNAVTGGKDVKKEKMIEVAQSDLEKISMIWIPHKIGIS